MKEKYGCKVGLKSPAHITIVAPFWMAEENEATLTGDIATIATGVARFVVVTKNFSSFPPTTLFIAVHDNPMLNILKKASEKIVLHPQYKIKKELRPFHPHITIATRDLHKKDFWEALEHFNSKSFEKEFTATGLSLLKHNGQVWEVAYEAVFTARD